MIGTARVAKAAPDGYQVILGNVGTHAGNQTLYRRPLYNTATDFAPVFLVVELPRMSRDSKTSTLPTVRALPAGLCAAERRSGKGPGRSPRSGLREGGKV